MKIIIYAVDLWPLHLSLEMYLLSHSLDFCPNKTILQFLVLFSPRFVWRYDFYNSGDIYIKMHVGEKEKHFF